jgi:hypothetical protein
MQFACHNDQDDLAETQRLPAAVSLHSCPSRVILFGSGQQSWTVGRSSFIDIEPLLGLGTDAVVQHERRVTSRDSDPIPASNRLDSHDGGACGFVIDELNSDWLECAVNLQFVFVRSTSSLKT